MKREQWNIIAKYFAKEDLNTLEQEYISDAKADNEKNKMLNAAQANLKKVDLYFNLKKINTNAAWEKISVQLSESKKVVPFRTQLLRIAAIFLLILATGFGVWQVMNSKQTKFQTAQNDLSCPELILPDGSKVILSHGSQLAYPTEFNGNNRKVQLTGEAFFEVTPNAQKPFIIETTNASVKVLGTSFNVFANEASDRVEVFVRSGKVELIEGKAEANAGGKIILLPGEKGTFEKSTRYIFKETAEKDNSLAWMTHEIKFQLTNLHEVVSTLERVYSLNINVDSNVDLNQKITATFNQQNPDYIMEVVAITLDLNLSKTGDNSYQINK